MRLSRSGTLSVLLHAVVMYGLIRAGWRHTPRRLAQRQATIVWLADAASRVCARRVRRSDLIPRQSRPPRTQGGPADALCVLGAPRPTRAPPVEVPTATCRHPRLARAGAGCPSRSGPRRRRAAANVADGAARRAALRSRSPGRSRDNERSSACERASTGSNRRSPCSTSPAKGRAGLAEEPKGPFGVHWVSDDCYVFHEPLDRFLLPGLFVDRLLARGAWRAPTCSPRPNRR